MQPRDFALAGLAGTQGRLTPVQIQKLLFLLDRNIGQQLGGSGFAFQPYHYGPFDRRVYTTLEALRNEGLTVIDEPVGGMRTYGLTDAGRAAAATIFATLPANFRTYISQVQQFVRSQSFAGLVSSIYQAYPEMKANSVFQE
jgi:hypothetical protein